MKVFKLARWSSTSGNQKRLEEDASSRTRLIVASLASGRSSSSSFLLTSVPDFFSDKELKILVTQCFQSNRNSSDQKSYLAIFPTMETIDFLLDALLPLLSPAIRIFDSDCLTVFTG